LQRKVYDFIPMPNMTIGGYSNQSNYDNIKIKIRKEVNMATGKDWDTWMKTIPTNELLSFEAYLEGLKSFSMFEKEFKSTGIFNLIWFIKSELATRPDNPTKES